MEDLSSAIQLGAADGTVFFLRGLAYQELGQDTKSRTDIAEALRRDPNLVNGLFESGSSATTGQR